MTHKKSEDKHLQVLIEFKSQFSRTDPDLLEVGQVVTEDESLYMFNDDRFELFDDCLADNHEG